MQLPPNDFFNQKQSHKATEQLLIDARNLYGLSGELLGTYLFKFDNSKEQYEVFSLCCNFFQMEKRFNLKLIEMNIDVFNYQYNTDMLFNTPLVKYDLVTRIDQFLEAVQTGKQPLVVRSPNRGRY
ncbi:hypothetical protein [Aliikangiella sp. IMCC44359]|uniref:hypothetical protein n=1 Tax=Aliikangiella sp. IMCC44359 TaxID=3459125 RepID=UPI00403B23AF